MIKFFLDAKERILFLNPFKTLIFREIGYLDYNEFYQLDFTTPGNSPL